MKNRIIFICLLLSQVNFSLTETITQEAGQSKCDPSLARHIQEKLITCIHGAEMKESLTVLSQCVCDMKIDEKIVNAVRGCENVNSAIFDTQCQEENAEPQPDDKVPGPDPSEPNDNNNAGPKPGDEVPGTDPSEPNDNNNVGPKPGDEVPSTDPSEPNDNNNAGHQPGDEVPGTDPSEPNDNNNAGHQPGDEVSGQPNPSEPNDDKQSDQTDPINPKPSYSASISSCIMILIGIVIV